MRPVLLLLALLPLAACAGTAMPSAAMHDQLSHSERVRLDTQAILQGMQGVNNQGTLLSRP